MARTCSCEMQSPSRIPICRPSLSTRDKEAVAELLLRLDAALGQALSSDTVIDELLPELQRCRPRRPIPLSQAANGPCPHVYESTVTGPLVRTPNFRCCRQQCVPFTARQFDLIRNAIVYHVGGFRRANNGSYSRGMS